MLTPGLTITGGMFFHSKHSEALGAAAAGGNDS